MKKNIWIACGVIVGAILFGFLLLNGKYWDTLSNYQFPINPKEEIVLNFEDADVSINEWNMDDLKVTYDNVSGPKKNLDFEVDGNTVILKTQLDFSNFKHLIVYVPKSAVVSINAHDVKVQNTSIHTITANQASLRYANLINGFVSKGTEIEVRESKLAGSANFANQTIALRECRAGSIVISTDNPDKNSHVEIREHKGGTVLLSSKVGDHFQMNIRDSSLDLLSINENSTNDEISIVNSKINKVENESDIEIKYPQSPNSTMRNALIAGMLILLVVISAFIIWLSTRKTNQRIITSNKVE